MSTSGAASSGGVRVCVVGSGFSGLVAAKVLHEDGFDVTVYDKEREIGGVWASTRTYPGLRANNPRETYCFSDLPYPGSADEFPTAAQIREYHASYVDAFDLRPLIQLSTRVLEIVPADSAYANGSFDVRVQDANGMARTEVFDKVVVCNGVFSVPRFPVIQGQAQFSGTVLHSSQATEPAVTAGKRVVVIGAGKSALDGATWAGRHATSCTLVFRDGHWMVPRHFFGRLRSDYVVMNRFSEMFLEYPRRSGFERWLHQRARGIVERWWQQVGRVLKKQVGMPSALEPSSTLPSGFTNIGVGAEFFAVLKEGRVTLQRDTVKGFDGPSTLCLESGTRIEADTVICATGWQRDDTLLSPALRDAVLPDGRFRLYRHVLPPKYPRLGFVGYASSTACSLSAEVAAHWLSEHFLGSLRLPSQTEMEASINEDLAWAAHQFPKSSQGHFIGPNLTHYVDELMLDLGLRPRRLSNPVAEFLSPVWCERYAGLADERRRLKTSTTPNDRLGLISDRSVRARSGLS